MFHQKGLKITSKLEGRAQKNLLVSGKSKSLGLFFVVYLPVIETIVSEEGT